MARKITTALIVLFFIAVAVFIALMIKYSGSFFVVHNACSDAVEVSTTKSFEGKNVWTLKPDDSLDDMPGSTEIWIKTPTDQVYSANGAIGPLVNPGNLEITGPDCDQISITKY